MSILTVNDFHLNAWKNLSSSERSYYTQIPGITGTFWLEIQRVYEQQQEKKKAPIIINPTALKQRTFTNP